MATDEIGLFGDGRCINEGGERQLFSERLLNAGQQAGRHQRVRCWLRRPQRLCSRPEQ